MGIPTRILAALTLSLLAPNARAADSQDERIHQLAFSRQWLKLGHWDRGLLGAYRSEVVSPSFFLSSSGQSDPEGELRSTISAMESPAVHEYLTAVNQPDRQHPICQFPARFSWLKENGLLDEAKIRSAQGQADCKRFQDFKRMASAKSVSVVFSAYRLNHPSSVFGHSLLRLNKGVSAENGERHELLDLGINFAAEATASNPVSYVFKGLFGGFRGTYSAIPYFYKVREYDDFESRDLWSYDLSLTPQELELLVAHIWELGTATFDYFYLTQNCSYEVLTAIEAAAPRFTITEKLPFYVIPGDTIRQLLQTPGLVTRISHRPSARSQFDTLASGFTSEELRSLQRMVLTREDALPPESFTVASRVRVLDAAIGYVDYRFPKELLDPKSASSIWKQELLMARASIPVKSPAVEVHAGPRGTPHIGHESARAAVEFGHDSQNGAFIGPQLRFALHDLLDPAPGYPARSQVEFFNIRLRAYSSASPHLELENFTLLRVLSIDPLRPMNKEKSWGLGLGARTLRDADCGRCLSGYFDLQGGAAIAPWGSESLALFATGGIEADASSEFRGSKLRLGVGPTLGFLHSEGAVTFLLKTELQHRFFSRVPRALTSTLDLRWNPGERLSVGLGGRHWVSGSSDLGYQHDWDASGSLYIYY